MAELATSSLGTMPSIIPLSEPVTSSSPDGVGGRSAVCLAESAAGDDGGQNTGSPPAASEATELMADGGGAASHLQQGF